jgi:hypothetical protein
MSGPWDPAWHWTFTLMVSVLPSMNRAEWEMGQGVPGIVGREDDREVA